MEDRARRSPGERAREGPEAVAERAQLLVYLLKNSTRGHGASLDADGNGLCIVAGSSRWSRSARSRNAGPVPTRGRAASETQCGPTGGPAGGASTATCRSSGRAPSETQCSCAPGVTGPAGASAPCSDTESVATAAWSLPTRLSTLPLGPKKPTAIKAAATMAVPMQARARRRHIAEDDRRIGSVPNVTPGPPAGPLAFSLIARTPSRPSRCPEGDVSVAPRRRRCIRHLLTRSSFLRSELARRRAGLG